MTLATYNFLGRKAQGHLPHCPGKWHHVFFKPFTTGSCVSLDFERSFVTVCCFDVRFSTLADAALKNLCYSHDKIDIRVG